MKERAINEELLTSAEQYWNDPRVIHAVLQFMGGSGYSWEDITSTAHEYIGVATEEKASSGGSPVRTMPPHTFPDFLRSYSYPNAEGKREKGRLELYVSYLHHESSFRGKPKRLMFCWDIDRFRFMRDNNYDEGSLIRNASETFESLESTYYLYKNFFARHNIPVLSVMSGKGYHFFTQVSDPDVIDQIQQYGSVIEPTVQGKLEHSHRWSKAPGPIPLFHEQGFKGTVRLQQFVNTQLIKEARRRTKLAVEIWDKGNPGQGTDGIAIDNTAALFTVNNKIMSALGSIYFLKSIRSGARINRMLPQLPLSGNGFENHWRSVLPKRYFFTQMDSSFGDDPSSFNTGYRNENYEGVIRKTPEPEITSNSLRNANPMLLQNRFYLDHFIFQLFQIMGKENTSREEIVKELHEKRGNTHEVLRGNPEPFKYAPHVAGILRAIYEDPQFGWGGLWMRHQDALRWARGSVEQALGQLCEAEHSI